LPDSKNVVQSQGDNSIQVKRFCVRGSTMTCSGIRGKTVKIQVFLIFCAKAFGFRIG
jgi:hypothetical protein